MPHLFFQNPGLHPSIFKNGVLEGPLGDCVGALKPSFALPFLHLRGNLLLLILILIVGQRSCFSYVISRKKKSVVRSSKSCANLTSGEDLMCPVEKMGTAVNSEEKRTAYHIIKKEYHYRPKGTSKQLLSEFFFVGEI